MKMFKEYFDIKGPVDINIFSEDIVKYINKAGKRSNDANKMRAFTDDLLAMMNSYVSGNADTPSMLEMLSCVLRLKDNENGKNLMQSIGFGKETYKKLNESVDLTKWNSLNIASTTFDTYTDIKTKEDIRFYGSLKAMLHDRFKDAAMMSMPIRDTYQKIMNYVQAEINEIEAAKQIREVDEQMYSRMINDIITTPQLDGRYLSPDYMKTITSDVQTLLFDMTVIVNSYIDQSFRRYGDYIDPNKIYEYRKALKVLVTMIASSSKSSYLVNTGCCKCCENSGEVTFDVTLSNSTSLVSYSLQDLRERNFNRLATDCVSIMKSLQSEFVLNIRKAINMFATKAYEMIHSLRMVDMKLDKSTSTIMKN